MSPAQRSAPEDLSFRQCCRLIDQLAAYAPLTLVFTGGEPLWRRDFFDLVRRARDKNLSVVVATNGALLDESMVERIREAGIQRVAVSLDGAEASTHDGLRGHAGLFASVVRGLGLLHRGGVPTQINTAVTRRNVGEVAGLVELAGSMGARSLHLLLMVPAGCGLTVPAEQAIRGEQTKEFFAWFYRHAAEAKLELSATCIAHYHHAVRPSQPLSRHSGTPLAPLPAHGLLGMIGAHHQESGVCFLSHQGEVYPWAYLPVSAGSLLQDRFQDIWERSGGFEQSRERRDSECNCGMCEFQAVCPGCLGLSRHVSGDRPAAIQ